MHVFIKFIIIFHEFLPRIFEKTSWSNVSTETIMYVQNLRKIITYWNTFTFRLKKKCVTYASVHPRGVTLNKPSSSTETLHNTVSMAFMHKKN